jgi:hypothetical protein
MDLRNGKSIIDMIRVIKKKEYMKNAGLGIVLGYLRTIDTETGVVTQCDYNVKFPSKEALTHLDNLKQNGLLENYKQYFPSNLKIKKGDRSPNTPDEPPTWEGDGNREPIGGI